MTELVLADPESVVDLQTYLTRAKSAEPEGAARLLARGDTLAAYVGILPGSGLMADGAAIGLRTMRLARPETVDVTVTTASLLDRLARIHRCVLSIPPVSVTAPWAAVAPPRTGWKRGGTLSGAQVYAVAQAGIAAVAQAARQESGADIGGALRDQVWLQRSQTYPAVPAGGAFAAYVLGFVSEKPGSSVDIWTHRTWIRLSTEVGHVLVRPVREMWEDPVTDSADRKESR